MQRLLAILNIIQMLTDIVLKSIQQKDLVDTLQQLKLSDLASNTQHNLFLRKLLDYLVSI